MSLVLTYYNILLVREVFLLRGRVSGCGLIKMLVGKIGILLRRSGNLFVKYNIFVFEYK